MAIRLIPHIPQYVNEAWSHWFWHKFANDTSLCNLQVLVSRDCLFQAAAMTTKWIHYFIFGNDSHFHYLYDDHSPFMQLYMHSSVETNQSHNSNSEGAAFENDSDSEGLYLNINLGFLIQSNSNIATWLCYSSIFDSNTSLCKQNDSIWYRFFNNSATAHICNDKSLFLGELVPLIYVVSAAMGTSKLTLMGTVILCTTDDNGKKHTFMLTHVNYMPKLPVNLLSTWVHSKQYINKNRFDKEGN